MIKRNRELWYALLAIAAVSAVYLTAYRFQGSVPTASGLVGHGIGILGFALMLMTETLYSIRKLLTDARWGNMESWLRFHIVTGLVGPYMVLLHAAMMFQGLAGVTMLLTVVVVISGVVGRYLYTAMPHAATLPPKAAETVGVRAAQPHTHRGALATWHALHVPLTWMLFTAAFVHVVAALYYATLQR